MSFRYFLVCGGCLRIFFCSSHSMTLWKIKHRDFVYDSYVKDNESVTVVQCEFRRYFKIQRNQTVLIRNAILCRGNAVCTGSTLMNRRPIRAPRTVRTPGNVEHVTQAFIRSLNRSSPRHSIELDIGNRLARHILHEDMSFHP